MQIVLYPLRALWSCGRAGGAVAQSAAGAAGGATSWFKVGKALFDGARWLWNTFRSIVLGGFGKCGAYLASHWTTLQREVQRCWRASYLVVYTALAIAVFATFALTALRAGEVRRRGRGGGSSGAEGAREEL